MYTYMHAQFAALMTLPTTEPRRMPIVSCALIYDTAIRVSSSHSARLLLQQSRASYMLPFLPSGSPYINS